LLLAGLPAAAFLSVDYLLAPPFGSQEGPAVSVSMRSGNVASKGSGSGATGSSHALRRAMHFEDSGIAEASNDGERAARPTKAFNLVTSIQNELRRVGCYAGAADGMWNDQTRVAMRAFNSSVHVNLGTDQPDYVLLTLLQGHSSKACSRSCDALPTGSMACIDRSIEARALPPTILPARAEQSAHRSEAQMLSEAVPAPIMTPRSSSLPQASVTGERAGRRGSAEETLSANAPVSVSAPISSEKKTHVGSGAPLAGRMAVGALLPSSEERQGAGSSADMPTERAREPAFRTERSRPQHVMQRRPQYSSAPTAPRSKLSRTFTDLSRNSP